MRGALLIAAKCLAGFALGLTIWSAFGEPYNVFLARAAQPALRLFEHPPVTRLQSEDEEIVIDRADFQPGSERPAIPTPPLTASVILLTSLFAANRKPLWTANVTRFAIACLILAMVHVVAVIVSVQSIYALHLGPWSARNYGPIARNFWGAAEHFYVLAGSFGSAFLLWWLLRPTADGAGDRDRARKGRARRKSH